MDQQYELITFQNNAPLQFVCYKTDHLKKQWNRTLEILLFLKGDAQVNSDGKDYLLHEGDVILFNENVIHEIVSPAGCIFASLQIDTAKVPSYVPIFYDCNSAEDNNQRKYNHLRYLMARLVKDNSDIQESNPYTNWAMIYRFLKELTLHFVAKSSHAPKSQRYMERATNLISYIDAHYQEGLSLKKVAEDAGLSVPYLSSFFEKYLGTNFLSYYTEVRLSHAYTALMSTDKTIESIALGSGFPSPRSFVFAFKEKYGELPSAYRKNHLRGEKDEVLTSKIKKLDSEGFLTLIAQYLGTEDNAKSLEEESQSETIMSIGEVDLRGQTKTLKKTFKRFVTVGRAKELLYSDIQEELREFQKKMGFTYIKFHGLLSDDMLVYRETEGEPHYSFVEIDKVFDFILSIHLKPLVQFSFMPKDLAKHPERVVYASPYVISEPKSMERWNELIARLLEHFAERYGKKEMESWLYSVWNEPDTGATLFGFDDDEVFFSLYKNTFDTVKRFDSKLSFGSPSMILAYQVNRDWCDKFITWCKAENCVPDFMNIHYYDNDFEHDKFDLSTPAHPTHGRLNRDENHFRQTIPTIKKSLEGLGISQLPVYLTEWNLTVSHRNLLNDTVFKSCYLAKNVLENYDAFQSFGYWVLSDFIEETQPSEDEFHGGLGLYTIHGIKKPHYFTFLFLNQLGMELIAQGDGYFITKNGEEIVMILYNYQHFNYLYATGETFDMTFTKRYTPFSKLGGKRIDLTLKGFSSDCLVKESIVNQHHGSAFDEWVAMGAQKLDEEGLDYLKHVAYPKELRSVIKIEDGKLPLSFYLQPLEVRLIRIKELK